jgi:hypothetical protein
VGVHQSDVWIREAILLGLEDIRKNIWLLDDIFSDFTTSTYLKAKYSKQTESAKEWFLNNNVEVVMGMRNDTDRLPCVSITLGNSSEKNEMKLMGDASPDTVKLMPNTIGKPIPYVKKPFQVLSYDINSGLVAIDPAVDLTGVSAGMILVNPQTGQGYVIQDLSAIGLMVLPGLTDMPSGKLGIVPQFQYYEARVEHTFFQETYNVECHAHGDPQVLLWLHSIVLYSILRYRESLLEANGFCESTVSSSDISRNPNYTGPGGEQAFTRVITLYGQVENSWIKSPRRFIETVATVEPTSDGFVGGIKILSNSNASDFLDITKENWFAVDDTDGEYDEDSGS